MSAYYFYLVTARDHICSRREAFCTHDADAVETASRWLATTDGYAVAVEVWDRARRVARVTANSLAAEPIGGSVRARCASPSA